MFAQVRHDWCHVCGERKNTVFAELSYDENAEHPSYETEHYLRVCEMCVREMMHKIQKEAEKHGLDEGDGEDIK